MSYSPEITSFDINEIIASLPGNVYWVDQKGILLGCNQNQAKSYGFNNPEDVIGKQLKDISSDDKSTINHILENNLQVIKSGKPASFEESLTMPNGAKLTMLSKKVPLRNKQGEVVGILGVSVDITEQHLSVSGERAKNFILENIIAMTPGTVYWIDRDGVYQGCNDNEAEAVGLGSRDDIVGKTNEDLKGFLIPEALDPVNEKVMSTNAPITLEEPAILNDGTKATFLSSKKPLHNDEGEVIGMVGISINITAEKHAEQLEREKLVAEKQSEVMKLMSSAIAHELRTPQASIDMTCEQLKDVWPILLAGYKAALDMGCDIPTLPDDVFEDLSEENIGEHLMRINNNCRTIVNMMNKNVLHGKLNGKLVRFSPKQVIENTIKDYPYRSSLEERVVKGVSGADFSAKGDPDLFEHVILNLLKNAIYHVLLNREGHIEVRLVEDDNCNTIYFEDTGPGISQEDIDKIFESFFTKNTDNGTGVGLSLCKNVIENNMRGKIWCESELGKYTRFCLQLPKVNDTN